MPGLQTFSGVFCTHFAPLRNRNSSDKQQTQGNAAAKQIHRHANTGEVYTCEAGGDVAAAYGLDRPAEIRLDLQEISDQQYHHQDNCRYRNTGAVFNQ